MRVGIIGAGNMGSAFAKRLSAAGHQVYIASRDFEDARDVADSVGNDVRAVRQDELGANADVLIAATPFREQAQAVQGAGEIDGKVVVEISNPMNDDGSGLAVGFTTSAAEEVARDVPRARIVKAFNTVFASVLSGASGGGRAQVFYAGDDEQAKSDVNTLIESAGFEPVDAGPLRNARYLEPLGMLNIYFGYVAKLGTDIAPAMRRVQEARDGSRSASAEQREKPRVSEESPRA